MDILGTKIHVSLSLIVRRQPVMCNHYASRGIGTYPLNETGIRSLFCPPLDLYPNGPDFNSPVLHTAQTLLSVVYMLKETCPGARILPTRGETVPDIGIG